MLRRSFRLIKTSANAGDASNGLFGRTVQVQLEEHPFKKQFPAKIVGMATVLNDHREELCILHIDGEPAKELSHTDVVFRPVSIKFKGHFLGVIRYKPSLREFVLHRDPAHKAIVGRLYGFPAQNRLDGMVLKNSELFMLAYCHIT